MSLLSQPHFHSEVAAIARLEAIVWPQGPFCPRCGGFDRITTVKGGRAGLRRCGPCKREFTATVGTIFERSHVKLHKWFQSAHLMASGKKGISAHQLHRTLKVTYKTAWFMEHRLREAVRELHPTTQRAKTLRPILQEQIHAASDVMSDDGGSRVASEFARHQSVNHSIGEYVRGDAHTKTIEGYFLYLEASNHWRLSSCESPAFEALPFRVRLPIQRTRGTWRHR
jgi:transposase-like protein